MKKLLSKWKIGWMVLKMNLMKEKENQIGGLKRQQPKKTIEIPFQNHKCCFYYNGIPLKRKEKPEQEIGTDGC
ncbi:MAG: hypothetical protein MR208_08500 [Oscillospiraceae bacterium]|nr:hypothetical protein [Oscillospiraceae bacterium]